MMTKALRQLSPCHFIGVWRGDQVAVKVIVHSQADESRIQQELSLSLSFDHPNLVRALHYDQMNITPGRPSLVSNQAQNKLDIYTATCCWTDSNCCMHALLVDIFHACTVCMYVLLTCMDPACETFCQSHSDRYLTTSTTVCDSDVMTLRLESSSRQLVPQPACV